MAFFSPQALSLNPQAVADSLTGENGAPGALISISDGTRFAAVASGLSDLDGTPAQTEQSFQIGSQSKIMTALVVLQLAEEGLIDLDEPFASYIDPELISGVVNADRATVQQALTMKTGIPNYTEVEREDGTSMDDFFVDHPDEVFDGEEILELVQGLPAVSELGSEYYYSNTNYFYLSMVIEAVTGKDLGAVFDERIFAPLGMSDTYLNDFRDDPKEWGSFLEVDDELYDVSGVLSDNNGAGGVVSTLKDMTTFFEAMFVDQTLVSENVLATMMNFDNGSMDPDGYLFNSGLVQLEIENVGTFVGFSGGTIGTDSATYLHLESGRVVSAVINRSDSDASATLGLLSTAILAMGDEAWEDTSSDQPFTIDGVSAAQMAVQTKNDLSELHIGDAHLKLGDAIRNMESNDFTFTDGSQLLLGSRAADVLSASGSADDHIRGFGGDDRLNGGAGNDVLHGGAGADTIKGGTGADTLRGSRGEDQLFAGQGDDLLYGGTGHDSLRAGRGDDQLRGGAGNDFLLASGGDDYLSGGRGHDRLLGGTGDDALYGSKGNDVLFGGTGDDRMTGGSGADVFVFRENWRDDTADLDVITDFDLGVDQLQLRGRTVTEQSVEDTGLLLTLDGDGDAILLLGLTDELDLSLL